MKAVNLLPEKHRPRKATGGQQGSSYILLGGLGAIVVAVLLYVLSANSINSAKTEIADAKAETQQANAQVQALGVYGDFAKVKQQRVASVKSLAQSRFDWERLVRELAQVLPSGVWIQNASASDSPAEAQPSSSSGSTSTAPGATSSPTLTLQGCAPDQRTVAVALVRLRELQGAADVKLDTSKRPEDVPSASGSSGGGSGGDGECGTTHGHQNYSFQADVSFEAPSPAPYKKGAVPTRLGGGQ